MNRYWQFSMIAAGVMIALAAQAQSTVNVPNSGALTVSTTLPGGTGAVTNVLSAPPSSFTFAGTFLDGGTFQAGAVAGYLYDDYILTVPASVTDTVTVSLSLPVSGLGVSDLQTRWYNLASNGNTFLQGAAGVGVASGVTTSVPGALTSVISSVPLTAGTYVFELAGRLPAGTTLANYTGIVSLAPVPEADSALMVLAGLGLLAVTGRARRKV